MLECWDAGMKRRRGQNGERRTGNEEAENVEWGIKRRMTGRASGQSEIRIGYIPGLIGRVTELHARYYSANWNFGVYFESKVAGEMAAFMARYDPALDRVWTVLRMGRIHGSLSIDRSGEQENTAHLRWFIMSESLRGRGFGNELISRAMDFCREQGYARVYLWTFQGLEQAGHLYHKAGFELVESFSGDQWGTTVPEQRFEARLL